MPRQSESSMLSLEGATFSKFTDHLLTRFCGESFNDVGMLLAGGRGFEPRLTGPEPAVLPLDDPPSSSPS